MFTVEQFQQAASSQDPDSEPCGVYIVRPTAIWESLGRFKRIVGTNPLNPPLTSPQNPNH